MSGGSPEVRELFELAAREGRWWRGYGSWLRWRMYATLDEAGDAEEPYCREALESARRGESGPIP